MTFALPLDLADFIGNIYTNQFDQLLNTPIQTTNILIRKRIILQLKMDQQTIPPFEPLPIDEQGFTKSFNIDEFDEEQASRFFEKFGVIVFDNVIGQQDFEKTIDDLWTDLQTRCGKENIRNDPTTWKFDGWKGSFGFVNGAPLNYKQICLNRQNPKVYKIFKKMYEITSKKPLEQPLLAMFDRGSAMRPGEGHPQWVTHNLYHFDMNPWWWTGVVKATRKDWRGMNDYQPQKFAKWLSEGNKLPPNGYTKLAGVLALTDTSPNSGGFECVCGFQNWIKQWCQRTQPNSSITSDEELMARFQKVLQRKGSLLIFTRELPHNIFQNLSGKWRFAQYLRMAPLSSLMLTQFQQQKRKACVRHFLPPDLPVDDPISKQVYMMD